MTLAVWTPVILRGFARDGVSFAGAIAGAFPTGSAAALVYTPRRCLLAEVRDGAAVVPADARIDFEEAYEGRVFDASRELRWRREAGHVDAVGRAVLLSEDGGLAPPSEWTPLEELEAEREVDDALEYLLWGSMSEHAPAGHVRMWEPRVPPIDVPTSLVAGALPAGEGRLAIRAREYVCEDAHGNAYVADERLLGIAWSGSRPISGGSGI